MKSLYPIMKSSWLELSAVDVGHSYDDFIFSSGVYYHNKTMSPVFRPQNKTKQKLHVYIEYNLTHIDIIIISVVNIETC